MVSCIMCTYGRMHYVERSYSFFLAQDFKGESELIIFNTDPNHDVTFITKPDNVNVINNSIDYVTGKPYTNIGAIRRDALTHAKGDYFITWDDDDVFLPWAIRQRYDNIIASGNKAWKSSPSFFMDGNKKITLQDNTFEAACIVKMDEVTFSMETGSEAVGENGWYTRLRDEGELIEYSISLPDYAFEWYDHFSIKPHRQSGDINNPSNFDNHKANSTDYHIRPIGRIEVSKYYLPYYQDIYSFRDIYDKRFYRKYFASGLVKIPGF